MSSQGNIQLQQLSDELKDLASSADLAHCQECVQELGHHLRGKATQPTGSKAGTARLMDSFKSILGGPLLTSIRVTVVAREERGAMLASVGNLLEDVQHLTMFQCTTKAFLTTVMEGMHADTWRPIRDSQIELVHTLMHTYQDHRGGDYYFSLPIRCEEEHHVTSTGCCAIGLLTLGWMSVPADIPRVMPMVRAVAAAMGCGFGAAMQGLVNDVIAHIPRQLQPHPCFAQHALWEDSLGETEETGGDSDACPFSGPPAHPPWRTFLQGGPASDEDVTWGLEWQRGGVGTHGTWVPCQPGRYMPLPQEEKACPALPRNAQLSPSLPISPGNGVPLLGKLKPLAVRAGEGQVASCILGDDAEQSPIPGEDEACGAVYGQAERWPDIFSGATETPALCAQGEKTCRTLSGNGRDFSRLPQVHSAEEAPASSSPLELGVARLSPEKHSPSEEAEVLAKYDAPHRKGATPMSFVEAEIVVCEKQGQTAGRQSVVSHPSETLLQSALWLSFGNAELEARFLASQTAKALPLQTRFRAVGLLLFLIHAAQDFHNRGVWAILGHLPPQA